MTEYWLQKKTIGGWSMVTWYGDAEQAKRNYDSCVGNGSSGYSWRLVEVETIAESLLEEVVEVRAPELSIAAKQTAWGKPELKPAPVINGWGNPAIKPAPVGWGIHTVPKPEHGMVGKVWMMNHSLKQRGRFDPNEVESRKANGWIVAGPKTAFEG